MNRIAPHRQKPNQIYETGIDKSAICGKRQCRLSRYSCERTRFDCLHEQRDIPCVQVCWRQADQAEARKLSRYDCRAGANRSHENAWRYFEKRARRISKPTGALTLGELFDGIIEEYAQHHCTTWVEIQKNFQRYFDFSLPVPIDPITRDEVKQQVNPLGRTRDHHTSYRPYNDLRAVYSWGTKYGYFSGANPCTNITKFKTRARDRFIRPDEFENYLKALCGEKNIHFREYVYLSLFTEARQANVLSMRWDQIDFELGLWHIPITRNKKSQTIPLTDLALKVLNDRFDRRKKSGEWVFPSKSATGHVVKPITVWRKFMKRRGLQDLRMQD